MHCRLQSLIQPIKGAGVTILGRFLYTAARSPDFAALNPGYGLFHAAHVAGSSGGTAASSVRV
jgi:hypothetical protein